jgi:hypothetical protein
MERVSNRHEGDLYGKLLPFDVSSKIHVSLEIAEENAHLVAVQHTAWMLLNILLRLQGIVDEVSLFCPHGVPVGGRIVPFAPDETTLRDALVRGASKLPFVRFTEGGARSEFVVHVGPVATAGARINVYGEAWWGGIFDGGEVPHGSGSVLPFGPYIGACLAAAEIFKLARMHTSAFSPTRRAFYSSWTYRSGEVVDTSGPESCDGVLPGPIVLAGVGAVGCSALHALWATDIRGELMAADNDEKGVENSNLNRYSFFGADSIGKAKASQAAQSFDGHPLKVIPHDGGFEFFFQDPEKKPMVVLSAVDKNTVRRAVQDQYPGLLLSASTDDLRAELVRCGPPGRGACLACFNPPEKSPTDEEIRRELGQQPPEQARLARTLGEAEEAIREWVATGRCGETGGRILSHLRMRAGDPERFAVGFVSVAAGTMLAAQIIKEVLVTTHKVQVLNEQENRAVLQFWMPCADTNRARFYARQESCQKCFPGGIGLNIWSERYTRASEEFARSGLG